MSKEAKDGRVRLTVWLPREQIKAVKLIAIQQNQHLHEIVGDALDEYMAAHYGEEVARDLKQARTLRELREFFADTNVKT